MKRLLVVLLGVLYMAAGTGFTLREHYCMGKHIGAVIEHPANHDDTHSCDRCGMTKKSDDNGCCKDEVKKFETSDQITAKAFFYNGPLIIAEPLAPFVLPQPQAVSYTEEIPAAPAHGPPLISGVPLYLRVRCLLI